MRPDYHKVLLLDVGKLVRPDAVTVDALARLQLAVGRAGLRLVLVQADEDLRELVAFMGLAGVLECGELSLEMRGEAEEREELRGVQEEADPRDHPV